MYRKIQRFFRDDLWNFSLNRVKGWRYFGFQWLRVIYLSVRGFVHDQCTTRASSLTYYTIMSIVPILAISFAIAKSLGYNEYLRILILEWFQEQQIVWAKLFSFTDKLLEHTRGGVLAGIGLIVLLWSVIQLLHNMEGALNHIWGIKKFRSWRRTLSDYFALMIIIPILFLIGSSATVFAVAEFRALIHLLPIGEWAASSLIYIVNLIPYCLFWFLFSFIYFFMPNTKVHFSSALLGGVIAGSIYVIIQWIYIYFQIGVNHYGAIYGSFAALPLFLIWVQISWFILFLGAEISHAHQAMEEYEFMGKAQTVSYGFKRLLSLWIVHLALSRHMANQSPLNRDLLIHVYQIPHALAVSLLEELTSCNLLIPVENGYLPSQRIENLRISDVIEALDTKGAADFPYIDSKTLMPFEKALEKFRDLIEKSPENKLLIHVPHSF